MKLVVCLLCVFIVGSTYAQSKYAVPEVRFLNSPYGDFLHFLFNRTPVRQEPKLDSLLGTTAIPKINALIALPEIAASAEIRSYEELYLLAAKYYKTNQERVITYPQPKILSYSYQWPSYGSLVQLLRAGEPYYPSFERFWKEKIKPVEGDQIAAWKLQLAEKELLEKFFSLTRLRLKTDTLYIACMAFHPAGSANYTPAAIYSSPFRKADLGWFMGHEGTHLLLSRAVGADWKSYPGASEVIRFAQAKNLNPDDIEETLCHFLQFMLSKAIGMTPDGEVIYSQYPPGFRKELIQRMETAWPDYLKADDDVITFMLKHALSQLSN